MSQSKDKVLFHIHVDASWISQDFEDFLTKDLGFFRTDFVDQDGGKTEPLNHLTYKTRNASEFRNTFSRVSSFAKSQQAMTGYIEGEVISLDKEFVFSPHDPNVTIPFKLEMTSLPPRTFRESEFHLTLCPERSDPNLLRQLTEMGLMMIYMPKSWGIALIYTAQGKRNLIKSLVTGVSIFLEKAGGAAMCSLKEERVAKWWASDESLQFPMVVNKVHWTKKEEIIV